MGLGLGKVIAKSIGKALKDVAITAGTVGALAGLTAVQNPEVWLPIAAALPGPAGAVLLIAVPVLVKAAKDAIKHRDKV
jgi:hypothetical protein